LSIGLLLRERHLTSKQERTDLLKVSFALMELVASSTETSYAYDHLFCIYAHFCIPKLLSNSHTVRNFRPTWSADELNWCLRNDQTGHSKKLNSYDGWRKWRNKINAV
jgi:hypothetical protein